MQRYKSLFASTDHQNYFGSATIHVECHIVSRILCPDNETCVPAMKNASVLEVNVKCGGAAGEALPIASAQQRSEAGQRHRLQQFLTNLRWPDSGDGIARVSLVFLPGPAQEGPDRAIAGVHPTWVTSFAKVQRSSPAANTESAQARLQQALDRTQQLYRWGDIAEEEYLQGRKRLQAEIAALGGKRPRRQLRSVTFLAAQCQIATAPEAAALEVKHRPSREGHHTGAKRLC